MITDKIVRVGVGVFVFKQDQFLMLQRKGAHGDKTWSLPGGHIEYAESFEETAKREVREETGLVISNVRFGAITNDFFEVENKHYVTVWMLSDWGSGEPAIIEPDKCVNLQWRTFGDMPEPLFLPWQQLLKSEFIDVIKTYAQ